MTIHVVTPDHGEKSFEADTWETCNGSEGDKGNLWVGTYNGDDGTGVAEFAKGSWLFVYETRDEAATETAAAEPEWKAGLNDFPEGLEVWDRAAWERGDRRDPWLGEGPGGDSYSPYGPFTSTPPIVGDK